MRWDERQRAMLREIGIRLWEPQPDPVAESVGSPPPPAERGAGEAGASHVGAAAAARPVVLPATLAALDWPELREAVAACTACKLCEGRRQTVFGVGHPRAHWMIVGEAPGEQEDRQGEPFVGKSGQLLDNMLRAIALTRGEAEPARQVYIANTIKCRPPGNRNPEPDEVASCEPFLKRQLAAIRPRMIVALGKFAAQCLLRDDTPITRLRGGFRSYEGIPLMPTLHPAYLLRDPSKKKLAWDDLKAVNAALARVGIHPPKPPAG